MAEKIVHEGKTLKELEKEITCGICQEHYTEPKVLPCLHYYCKQCILKLSLRTGKNKPFSCPECRDEATLSMGGVDELKTAFFINRLMPMFFMLERTHSKVEVMCEACTESGGKAEAFCRQCAMFICNECVKSHKRMRPFNTHEIASLDDLKHGRTKPIVVSEPPTRKCLVHEEPLIIYCFDCDNLICHLCTVKDHKDHNFEFCKKASASAKEKLFEEMKPLREVRESLSHAVKEVATTKQEVTAQGDSVANTIQTSFTKLREILNTREQEMLKEAERVVQEKVDKLSAQVKSLSLASAEVQSIEDYIEQYVRHCADNEVVSMYTGIMKRIEREIEQYGKPGRSLEPVEKANTRVKVSFMEDLQHLCQNKARFINSINPSDFVFAMEHGKPAEVFKTSEFKLARMSKPTQENYEVVSYARSLSTNAITECNVDRTGTAEYSIQYTPTSRGHHELTVSVNGQEVVGSPFPVFVAMSPSQLRTPVKVWDVCGPCGVAVNSVGDIIVAQYQGDIIKYDKENQREVLVKYSQTKLRHLRDIALDNDDNIYCVDETSNKILKCSQSGSNIQIKELKQMGGHGLVVVGNEVFICDRSNKGTIAIYNRDLEYIRHIKHGNVEQLMGISVDACGNLYVVDSTNSLILVFSNEGNYLRSFGYDGTGGKVLSCPYGICVSGHCVYVTNSNGHNVSVFTTDGLYVTSFGSRGKDGGNFDLPFNVCIGKDCFVYVTDYYNNRVQIF